MSKMYYFFTNQRNLLQAATKGYLSPLGGWTRYRPDFEQDLSDFHETSLIFGLHPLPYVYQSSTSKTLHSVAIGVSEKTLVELGYALTDFGYVGRTQIFIDRIEQVIFESKESIRFLKVHSPHHMDLINPLIISEDEFLFKQSEVQTTPIDLKEETIPESTIPEKRLSRAIGALGHMLSAFPSDSNPSIGLQFDLLGRHLEKENWQIDWSSFESTIKQVSTKTVPFNQDQTALFFLLFMQSYLGVTEKNDIKRFKDLDPDVGGIKLKKHADILTFLLAMDEAAESFGSELPRIDRKAFFEEVKKHFKATTKAQKELYALLDGIIGIYEYRTSKDELEEQIHRISDPTRKLFLLGFEYFSRDPLDYANIYRLIQNHSLEIPDSVLCVALYLWGRIHGALSLQPLNLQSMFKMFGKRNFYSLALSPQESQLLLPPEQSKLDLQGDSISYLGAEYYLNEGPRLEMRDFEEYEHRISSVHGFKLDLRVEDHFTDVIETINQFTKSTKSIDTDFMEFFIQNIVPMDLMYSIAGKDFKAISMETNFQGKKPSISFSFEIDGESLSASMNFPSLKKLKDIIAKAVKNRKLTIAEKRLIREYSQAKEGLSEIESLGSEVIDDKKIEVEPPLKPDPEVKTGNQPPAKPKANHAKDEQKNEDFGPLFGSKSK